MACDRALPLLCFSELAKQLGQEVPEAMLKLPAEYNAMSCPLFVTWKVAIGERLRGCIGTFSDIPLKRGLAEYTATSAFRDRRFSPIQWREVPTLQCGVSLLTDFEVADDCFDWTVGTHGIRITFSAGGQKYSGTYLPEVMGEQGWDKKAALQSLVRKAGYHGAVDSHLLQSIELTRYQSKKAVVTYAEWLDYRQGLA